MHGSNQGLFTLSNVRFNRTSSGIYVQGEEVVLMIRNDISVIQEVVLMIRK